MTCDCQVNTTKITHGDENTKKSFFFEKKSEKKQEKVTSH